MRIFKVIITIILLASFVLVGTPIQYNCLEFNLFVILAGIVFGIYKLVFKKEKLICGKIDILVLLLYLAPIVPMLFGNNVSIEETLIATTRNVSLFSIYLMVKELLQKGKKEYDYVINILIIGGVFLALLGIDERLSSQLFRYMRFIGIPNILNHENRMFSSIGYANTFAIIIAVEIILCFEKLKKHKLVYSGIIYLFLLSMLLSYSRSVIAIFIVIFAIYILFSKRNRVYKIYVFFANVLLSILGMKLFDTLSTDKQYILAWISIIAFVILSLVIAKIICKLYKSLCKIKIKTYVGIALILTVTIVIIYLVGLQLKMPLELFEAGKDNKEVRYTISRVDKSTQYNFEFDLEALVSESSDSNYTIEIAEENKYYDTIAQHTIHFGDFVGKKEINFVSSAETAEMVIYFKSNSSKDQKGLKINSLHVNGKEIGLNYLYIPMRLVERIDSFSLNSKSLWERFVFHKDGLKIIKDNLLFGTGAKGWMYNYTDVQSYVYASTEVHSYPLQLVIENGILAIIVYVGVLVYLTLQIIKTRKITGIDIAFILLNLHAIIDFDMSFYVVMVMWITLLALATKKEHEKIIDKNNDIKTNKNFKYKLQFVVIAISLIAICGGIYAYNLSLHGEATVKEINRLRRKDKFNEAIELMKEVNKDVKYRSTTYNMLNRIDYENITDENLEYIYQIILDKKIIASTSYYMLKNEIIQKIITESSNKDVVERLANIVVEENDKMILNIKDKDSNRLTEEDIDRYLQKQQEIYEISCDILNNK